MIAIVLLVAGLLVQDRLLKEAARRVFVEQTGFDVEIGSVNASLWKSRVELENVEVRNPPNYPEPTAFVIQRATMTLDPWSLFRGETHLKELTLDVPRVVVVRNAEGETNLEQISGKRATKASSAGSAGESVSVPGSGGEPVEASGTASMETAPKPAAKPASVPKERPFRIDRLALKIGTVEYHDYRGGREPAVSEFNLNLEREGENIRSGEEIGALLVGGVMQSLVTQLFSGVGDNLKSAVEDKDFQQEVKKIGKNLKNAFKGLLENGK